MDYCIALKSFKCDRAYDNYDGADVRGREWCVEILVGLQRHSQTLTLLFLDAYDRIDPWHLKRKYVRLQGFQTLVALESLNVPWHVIMGSPAGVKNAQDCWESVGGWKYPNLRDVLPKKLRHLKISKTDFGTPDCKGIEQTLCSALPFWDAENDALSLNSVEFLYNRAHYYQPLPMNFWRIQEKFQKAGRKFEYKFHLDPHDFMWLSSPEGAKDYLIRFAKTLADEGPAGVQIALRTGVFGLPGKVMELLDLGKEWLDTEDAKEILFGEKIGSDAFKW
ncbi:hypothetical protein N0V95_008364 [Ascochyta clinopodiicola]|nr:hypothetical protein N0V95_008364 [Ascochyta clinopodiicola]